MADFSDTNASDVSAIVRELWARLDGQQWDGLAELLDPQVQVRYLHTGEVFDVAAYVRLNQDYPGRWRIAVEDLIAAGDRVVTLARVYDDEETYYVASFATVADGRITGLTEVWTDTGQEPLATTRPSLG